MKKYSFIINLSILVLFTQNVFAFDNKANIFMPDGQLITRPVKVYISGVNITEDMRPKLHLVKMDSTETKIYKPRVTAPDYFWDEMIENTPVPRTGTMLIFDLSDYHIPVYNSCSRVLPELHWNKFLTSEQTGRIDTVEVFLVSNRETFIGNGLNAFLITMLVFCCFLTLAWYLTRDDDKKILGLVSTSDGALSMSLTQMALWTIAVGLMVLAYSLLRLRVPDIPESLLFLMTFATLTSVTGHWQAHRTRDAMKGQGEKIEAKEGMPKLSSILYVYPEGYTEEDKYDPSIAKAQILFWTLTTLIIFIFKSIAEGQLWDVPWQLVALMGISQGNFLMRKEMALTEAKKPKETPEK